MPTASSAGTVHPRPRARRSLLMCLALGAATAAIACRTEKPSVDALYLTRALGASYLQRNQLAEAESAFKKLTDLAPDDAFGYASLGLTYLQAGRYADAEGQLTRALRLEPGNADVGLALARVYALTGRPAEARATLERMRHDSTGNAHVLYALAQLDSGATDAAGARRYLDRLRDVLVLAPANLAARLLLADAFARAGAADSAVAQLEEIRRIPPAPPSEARAFLDSTIQLLRADNPQASRATLDRFIALMQGTAPYQASLENVRWAEGPIPGRPVLTFLPKSLLTGGGARSDAVATGVHFVDVTDDAGLATRGTANPADRGHGASAALAMGDVLGAGTDDLFLSVWSPAEHRSVAHLYRFQGGYARDVTQRSGIVLPQGATFAAFADVDNDGWLDLFVIGGEGAGHLFHNRGDGTFTDVTARAGVADVRGATRAVFADLDHDGDLDLLLLGNGTRTVFRNNLDGTFTEATAAFGLGGGGDGRDAVFGDLDGDGRLDLFIANAQGDDALFRNGGVQRFGDVTRARGVTNGGGSGAAVVGDYDNDGLLDLFVVSLRGESTLWLNRGNGTFARDARSAAALRAIPHASAATAALIDYDNDGWLDLVVGTSRDDGTGSVQLFRNDGTGRLTDRSDALPAPVRAAGAQRIVAADVDDDGDEDLLLLDAKGTARLLRNDGGNRRLAVNVALKGLRTGSGKNNPFGIGARLELRAGELYQTRVATGRVTHFGLGTHLKADVLRVEWPNGVPQTVYFPGSDQDVVERELLKGSCAFAYTWDGTRFRFVTDVMWRSALGMPLGLMGSTSAFAPAGASQEYIRIPGDALRPRNGRYVMQLTEELWETAYADEVKLIAVDHPDSVEVFVDERFVPPGPVALRVYQVAQRYPPRSATDERGRDVLSALRASDDLYVSNLVPTRYQGVVEPHALVMDLGEHAGSPDHYLFLRGWIYPTDASINVALGQQPAVKLAMPSVEVRDARGEWRTAIPSIGFPSGKDKTIVVDLAGKFPTADHHVRIRTNMQIYWDEAFLGRAPAATAPVAITTLPPIGADLHFRGYSRMFRKGGRYGPYWFAYDDVTTSPPWRPIDGAFTRFGNVLPLLGKSDDQYVIMAPGDETTLEFDARSATSLRPGWRRDFLLYSDGWIKDSDLNTAHGTTVGPLPFHGARAYPYAPGEGYPADSAHARYLREYDTRVVSGRVAPR